MLEDILLLLGGMPEYAIVDWREIEVLGDPSNPCWYSFESFM